MILRDDIAGMTSPSLWADISVGRHLRLPVLILTIDNRGDYNRWCQYPKTAACWRKPGRPNWWSQVQLPVFVCTRFKWFSIIHKSIHRKLGAFYLSINRNILVFVMKYKTNHTRFAVLSCFWHGNPLDEAGNPEKLWTTILWRLTSVSKGAIISEIHGLIVNYYFT